ncbi:MAG: MFS transporter [Negativicutes bacterium]|nr:MFS transporter [Negativicutes bacterium]
MASATNERLESMWRSKRFYVGILLFMAAVVNYVDRVNLSVAAPLIAKDFGWDPAMMGIIFSSFLWTYAACLVPAGWLTDKLGPRKLNSYSISIWSAAAMLTGAVTGFSSMLTARLFLGVGEAATWPSSGKVIRQWFPAKERGLATATFNSGSYFGPAIATPIVAWLVIETGWRASFFIAGAIGFVWLIFWLKYFRDDPKDCSWLPEDEREYIAANTDHSQTAKTNTPVRKASLTDLLKQKSMWGLALTQGSAVYTQYLFLTWLPTYLVQAKNFALMKAGIYSSLPYLIAVVLMLVAGKLSDTILTPERLAQGGRRSAVITTLLLSSLVLFTTVVDNDFVVLGLISVSLTCIATSITLNIALTNDLVTDPAIAGTAFGILILGGNIFGLTAPILTGFIVKATGNFDNAFFLAGAILICGAFISYALTRKPIRFEESTLDPISDRK